MNQSPMPSIEKIQRQFPDVAYFTPTMVSETVHLTRQQVYKYCKQLWPYHEGHYRFWCDYDERKYQLNLQNLNRLLQLIQQSHKNRNF